MNRLKKLLLSFRLWWYNLVILGEELFNKLQGRKEYISIDEAREQIEKQIVNEKLRKGVTKLVKKMYRYDEATGKYVVDSWAKKKGIDVALKVSGYKKSIREKFEEARVLEKVTKNPTDESGTTDRMVEHNVKRAPVYNLQLRKRKLWKLIRRALKEDKAKVAIRLKREIQKLDEKLNRLQ